VFSAKETYKFKEPTNRSLPICVCVLDSVMESALLLTCIFSMYMSYAVKMIQRSYSCVYVLSSVCVDVCMCVRVCVCLCGHVCVMIRRCCSCV